MTNLSPAAAAVLAFNMIVRGLAAFRRRLAQ
jgi:hypothetical protein